MRKAIKVQEEEEATPEQEEEWLDRSLVDEILINSASNEEDWQGLNERIIQRYSEYSE